MWVRGVQRGALAVGGKKGKKKRFGVGQMLALVKGGSERANKKDEATGVVRGETTFAAGPEEVSKSNRKNPQSKKKEDQHQNEEKEKKKTHKNHKETKNPHHQKKPPRKKHHPRPAKQKTTKQDPNQR